MTKNIVIEHDVEQSFEGWVEGIIIYNEMEYLATVEILYTFEELGLDYDSEVVYALSKVLRDTNTGVLGENLIKFFKHFVKYINDYKEPVPYNELEKLGVKEVERSYKQFLIQYERLNNICN